MNTVLIRDADIEHLSLWNKINWHIAHSLGWEVTMTGIDYDIRSPSGISIATRRHPAMAIEAAYGYGLPDYSQDADTLDLLAALPRSTVGYNYSEQVWFAHYAWAAQPRPTRYTSPARQIAILKMYATCKGIHWVIPLIEQAEKELMQS